MPVKPTVALPVSQTPSPGRPSARSAVEFTVSSRSYVYPATVALPGNTILSAGDIVNVISPRSCVTPPPIIFDTSGGLNGTGGATATAAGAAIVPITTAG